MDVSNGNIRHGREAVVKRTRGGVLRTALVFAVVASAVVGGAVGSAAAQENATGPTVEADDQTLAVNESGDIDSVVVSSVAANQSFYVDVHTEDDETVNTTENLSAGEYRDLELALDPAVEPDEELTVAVHATNGTLLANDTMQVTGTDGAVLDVGNETRTLDEGESVDSLSVDLAGATESFYVDVHTGDDETLNTTGNFSAGNERGLELALNRSVTAGETLTVAVHATNGTELAAQDVAFEGSEPATTTDEPTTSEDTTADDELGTTTTGDATTTSGSGPGFGVALSLLAIVGVALLALRTER